MYVVATALATITLPAQAMLNAAYKMELQEIALAQKLHAAKETNPDAVKAKEKDAARAKLQDVAKAKEKDAVKAETPVLAQVQDAVRKESVRRNVVTKSVAAEEVAVAQKEKNPSVVAEAEKDAVKRGKMIRLNTKLIRSSG